MRPLVPDINGYLQLDDSIIEVDLTPNRSDCLGIIGLARETGLMNNSRCLHAGYSAGRCRSQ